MPPCGDAERMRGVIWIEPRVVVEVSFSELMLGRLRDPVLRGLLDQPTRATGRLRRPRRAPAF